MSSARHSSKPGLGISPLALGTKLKAWLRLAEGTVSSGGYASVPDKLVVSNPAVANASRQPTANRATSRLPMATFATNDCLAWPLTAQNGDRTKWGFCTWIRLNATPTEQMIISRAPGTGGLNHQQIQIKVSDDRRLIAFACIDDSNGRDLRTNPGALPAVGTWAWVYMFYDGSIGGDASVVFRVNGAAAAITFGANFGAGGSLGTFQAATGNLLIGSFVDSASPDTPLAADIGPNFFIIGASLTASEELGLMNFERPDGAGSTVTVQPVFQPSQITAVSAWLRTADATTVSGDVSVLPDFLNSNPAVQTVAARRPTLELSAGNRKRCLRFATNDVLSWPITAQSSANSQAGWGMWLKPDAVSANQTLISIANATGGASGIKLFLRTSAASLIGRASPDGTNFKSSTTGTIDTGWHFVTLEYDSTAGSDGTKITVTVDGAVQTPVISGSATLGALFAATGNVLIGNLVDDVSAINPYNGLIGPDIYAFASKTAGATTGLMTTAERIALMNFNAPT